MQPYDLGIVRLVGCVPSPLVPTISLRYTKKGGRGKGVREPTIVVLPIVPLASVRLHHQFHRFLSCGVGVGSDGRHGQGSLVQAVVHQPNIHAGLSGQDSLKPRGNTGGLGACGVHDAGSLPTG